MRLFAILTLCNDLPDNYQTQLRFQSVHCQLFVVQDRWPRLELTICVTAISNKIISEVKMKNLMARLTPLRSVFFIFVG